MKILMINDHGYESGGVSAYIINLKKELEKHGHQVRFLSSDENSAKKHFSDFEYEGIIHKNILIRSLYRIFNPHSYLKTKDVLSQFKPDIVHLHNMLNYGSPSVLYSLQKHPTVMTIHDYYIVGQGYKIFNQQDDNKIKNKYIKLSFYYNNILNLIRDTSLKNVDQFIAPSKNIETEFKKFGFSNLKYINHGINLFNYSDYNNWNELLFVGRLSNEKGTKYLIQAIPKIIKKFPKVQLILIGEGPDVESLRELVNKLDLIKNVSFLGQIQKGRMEQFYKNSTIVIVPSIGSESFGLVGPEAMSVGRPVIASNIGGIPEWIEDGKTGFLVDPGNSDQIAEKVIQLLSDRKLLERMSKNARKQVEKFSIEKHVEKLEKIYLEVINKYKL